MELLIVVVVIGVVYSIAISKIKAPAYEKITPSFKNLKTYLRAFSKTSKVSFVCPDSYEKCFIEVNDKKVKEEKAFFDDSVEIYRYDYYNGVSKKDNNNFFSFSVDKNGVTDQVIIAYKNKVYDYTEYFDFPKIYNSLSEVVEAKSKLIEEITR
jgi:Tfp pilus assembly protein FimT